MRKPAHRLISVLVLALWMAPAVAALGVALHLALDHHGHHHSEHARDLSDLARTATHGHHHEAEAAPHHEHEATVDGSAAVPRPGPDPVATRPGSGAARIELAARSSPGGCPGRGSPTPLFTAHCALLL